MSFDCPSWQGGCGISNSCQSWKDEEEEEEGGGTNEFTSSNTNSTSERRERERRDLWFNYHRRPCFHSLFHSLHIQVPCSQMSRHIDDHTQAVVMGAEKGREGERESVCVCVRACGCERACVCVCVCVTSSSGSVILGEVGMGQRHAPPSASCLGPCPTTVAADQWLWGLPQ